MQTILSALLVLVLSLALSSGVRAEVVGQFLLVEGPVDLMKQDKLPAVVPKVNDGVAPGDVIRTKSQGRAQVKFVDDSVLTIAPGSRVAIETYMYDASKGTRKAVLQVFRGMVQAAVSKIIKTQEPDFIMKTHTAVLGVRGTKWFALLGPNNTDVYNESGRLGVRNLYSEIPGEVFLNAMEFSRVMAQMSPTVSVPFQQQDLLFLQRLLHNGLGGSPPPGSSGGAPPFAFLNQLGFYGPKNPVADPDSPFYRPPQLPPPPHQSLDTGRPGTISPPSGPPSITPGPTGPGGS